MRIKKFVPLTLENVGSEGKFFTDKTILKLGATALVGGYVFLVVGGQLGLILPSIISMPIGFIAGFIVFSYIVRYWVLRERMLLKLFKIMDKYKVINASEFCDVYSISKEGACLHESGHVSTIVEIHLGTTIGLNTQEIDNIFNCFEMFESRLLSDGVTFKTYGLEFVRDKFDELDEQQVRCSNSTVPNISNTMQMRNKYVRVYTEKAGRLDKVVYSIASKRHDAESLINLVNRLEPLFRHPNIHSFEMLDSYEKLNNFGEEFFGVRYFDLSQDSEEDLMDIIKFEED